MTAKLAFDVEEATRAYAAKISPEYAKLAKFAEADGASAGSTKAGLLKRSTARFVEQVHESASTIAIRASAVRDELRDPIYAHLPGDIADEVGSHARSIGFRTRMRAREIADAARRISSSLDLSKFTSLGSRIASAGHARHMLPAVVALAAIGVVTAGASLAVAGGDPGAVGTVGTAPSTVAATDAAEEKFFPIEMRDARIGFGVLDGSELLPGQQFMDAALATLTRSLGDAGAAQAHLDMTMSAFKVCIARSAPCSVHTAGIDMDPVKQRYIVSTMDHEGYFQYSSMEYQGEFVPLAGQDGAEPVDNPYSYAP